MPHLHSSLLGGLILAASGCGGPVNMTTPAVEQEVFVPVTIEESIPGTDIVFTLMKIPGGSFMIGSPDDEIGRKDDEGPQREVMVDSFYIGVHEVLYDSWSIFHSRENDNAESAEAANFDPDIIARPSPPYEDPAHGMGTRGHPAVGMTQWGALQYARWLSEKTGNFYRLPTEAEWEYACRAGTTSEYSFGSEDPVLYAWFSENSSEAYNPVGMKEPNPWGLFDMHGNVAEWTLDEYVSNFYQVMETNNPWSVPTRLYPRTVRGGAYDDELEAIRCAARLQSSADWKRRDPQIPKSMWWNTDSPFVGFRIVRPVNPPSPEKQEEFWTLVLGG